MKIVIVNNPSQRTRYSCAECEYSSLTVKTLQNHKKEFGHLSQGKTDINTDYEIIGKNEDYQKEIDTDDVGQLQTYQCHACPFLGQTKVELDSHLRTHKHN